MKTRPLVFIGSSREGLAPAKALQQNLEHVCEPVMWSQGVFGLSEGPLESLVKGLDKFDFAVLVLTPDDLVRSRGTDKQVPRDNVLFELGLFVGALGRERTFMACRRDAEMVLPTDLAGLTPAMFSAPVNGTWQSAMGACSTSIENAVALLGCRNQNIKLIAVKASYFGNRDGECGIRLTITNTSGKDLPPYNIYLFHPQSGTIGCFPSRDSVHLLSEQEREHDCTTWKDGKNSSLEQFFKHHEFDTGWIFQLKMDKSEKVLFQNEAMGTAIVSCLRSVFSSGNPLMNMANPEFMLRLCRIGQGS